MEKRIGIIIPVYNCENTLLRLLNSIYSQSYDNYEAIFVNDGSKDNSSNVIENFIKEKNCSDKIKLINQKNMGVSAARNKGLECINCDVVTFIDADDWYDQGFFQNINNNIKDFDFLVYDFAYIFKNSLKMVELVENHSLLYNSKKEFYEILCSNNLFNSSCNKVFSFDLVKNLRFNKNINFGEDFVFVINAFMNSKKFSYINKKFYNYDLSTGNLGFIKRTNTFYLKSIGLKECEKFYDKYNFDKNFLYKGFIKAFIIDISTYIVSNYKISKKEKSIFNDYRTKCYEYYDIRNIKISGIYGFLQKLYISNLYFAIFICSKIICFLINYKRKKQRGE